MRCSGAQRGGRCSQCCSLLEGKDEQEGAGRRERGKNKCLRFGSVQVQGHVQVQGSSGQFLLLALLTLETDGCELSTDVIDYNNRAP